MTSKTKQAIKTFVIRWELQWYLASALVYLVAVLVIFVVFPDVSNLWVSVFVLVSGFLATVAAAASAVKSNDTTE